MAFKWTMRLAPAGTLLGAGYLAVGYSDSAHGMIGENERPEPIVKAAAARQHERPLELMPSEIATTQPSSTVERLRVSGELEPINRAILRAKDGGRILEIRAREGEAIEAGNALRYRDLQSILKQREGHCDTAKAELLLVRQSLHRTEQPDPPAFSNSADTFGADTNCNHQLRQEHDL